MASEWFDGLRGSLSVLKEGFTQVVYPGSCLLCSRLLPERQRGFCDDCQHGLIDDPWSACPRCASTVGPFARVADGCSRCSNQVFTFEGAIRCGAYEGILRDAILRMKYHTGEAIAEAVAELWAEKARDLILRTEASLIVPVPLHWFKKLRRGYNQSEALARSLAARLNVPCRTDLLRKLRNTRDQVQRTATERLGNVRGAFWAKPCSELAGKAILLVDDVLTTGSTANEAAKALRFAGAKRIAVAVLAHSEN